MKTEAKKTMLETKIVNPCAAVCDTLYTYVKKLEH